MIDCGVLICGAGPVGMTVALELARHGVKPRIIDVDKGPTDLSKALVVWGRSLELLNTCMDAHALQQINGWFCYPTKDLETK